MEYVNSELGSRLIARKRFGHCCYVRHATPSDLGHFQPERSKCHDNVDRWCEEHGGHKPVRGWLLTGTTVFDRHSVVDLGNGQMLDITPLGDRPYSVFLPHDGFQSDFDKLPNQVVTVDI
jgi:hypothetical protein